MSLQEEMEKARSAKVRYDFKLPESLRKDNASGVDLPEVITFRELTAEQELMASKSGKFEMLRQEYAAVKLSIIELDGKPIGFGNGEIDKFWENAGPKVRSLLVQAYEKISAPSKAEADSFLATLAVRL